MAESAKSFPFMKLPVEIRIMVYTQIFNSLGQVIPARYDNMYLPWWSLHHDSAFHFDRDSNRLYNPIYTLFLVSKGIFNELMPLFYGKNHFHLGSSKDLYIFLSSIGPDRRGYLRTLSVQYQGTYAAAAFQYLLTCDSLKHLHLFVHFAAMQGQSSGTKSLVRSFGMSKLKKLRGLDTLEIDFVEPQPNRHNPLNLARYTSKLARTEFIEVLQVTKQSKAGEPEVRLSKRDLGLIK